EYLLGRGAEANIHCYHGDSPLHQAAGQGSVPMVEMLLGRWAQVDTRDEVQMTPLHWAARAGHLAVVRVLLQHGADPQARGAGGLSPAHAAGMKGQREIADLLRRAAAGPGSPAPVTDYRTQLIAQYPFYKTAVGKFAPIYPALAGQIVADYGVKSGICVDLGGGCGSLSMALARVTNLRSYVLDIDPAAVRLCRMLAAEAELSDRVIPIEGDAMALPFQDNFADLVVSRGSIFFWPSQIGGVREAYRILKPGGVAYLGGGFSRLLDKATLEGLKADVVRSRGQDSGGWKPLEQDLVEQCRKVGIEHARLLHEPDNLPERGWWIEVRK
ncbi:MAG: ankyrin repeat domain-containing protein, partial [Armatimonadota bacterium]